MHKKNNSKYKKIKIIAGKWKGYKISVPTNNLVRPTTSKMKETLFNWITPVITNAICLDCFTGSGALGLESLSRGAKKVIFIDHNYTCIDKLIKTIYQLKIINNKQIIHSDCRTWLKKKSEYTYDIIFIDPPFHQYNIIFQVLLLLEKHNHFSEKAWIYIETSKQQIPNININISKLFKFWALYRYKITQSNGYLLYFRNTKDQI